jgi:hypothetical protein
MKSRLWLALLCFAVCFAAVPVQARTQPIPDNPDGFTGYMASRAAEAMPAMKVSVKGPLELTIGDFFARLDTLWRNCQGNRPGCDSQIESYLAELPSLMQQFKAVDVRPADIRVVVRPAGYIDDVVHSIAGHPEAAPVVRPVAGDVLMICVVDAPRGIKMLSRGDLGKLGLTEDQAIALGLKNVAATLPPLAEAAQEVPQTGVKATTGNFYESSRMLLHDQWAEMSKAMGGHLIVAVPQSDLLIFGNGAKDGAMIATFARNAASKAPKPISISLFQWTPTGWEVVTP